MANSKEDAYLDVAENMFVYQNFTREEIAGRLKLSDKTVRVWAKKYAWETKKAALVECRRATHQELYELTRILAAGLRADTEAKKEISWQRISALNGLVTTLAGLKKYEDVVQVEREAKETESKKPDGAGLVEQVHEILGIQ